MAALVDAMAPDNLVVDIAAGADAGQIEIAHLVLGESGAACSLYSWVEIAVGAGGRASVVETFLGAGSAEALVAFVNHLAAFAAANANVCHLSTPS